MESALLEKPEWHYLESGRPTGPVTLAALQGRVKANQLKPTDWVWKEGMGDWIMVQSLELLFPATASLGVYSSPQWYYSMSGKKYGPIEGAKLKEMILRRDLLPTDLVQADGEKHWTPVSELPDDALREPPSMPFQARQYSYAGFTKRAQAFAIDYVILLIIGLLWDTLFPGYVFGIGYIYFIAFESSPWQASIGKRVMRIKVILQDGKRLTFLQALGRDLSKLASILTLGVGFAMAGWTTRKQTLHDLICKTFVINDDRR